MSQYPYNGPYTSQNQPLGINPTTNLAPNTGFGTTGLDTTGTSYGHTGLENTGTTYQAT